VGAVRKRGGTVAAHPAFDGFPTFPAEKRTADCFVDSRFAEFVRTPEERYTFADIELGFGEPFEIGESQFE